MLRRIKRRTLARLREEIAPVPGEVYARFVLDWHGLTHPRAGLAGLEFALARLEGLALPFAELERRMLPLRVPDYRPELLDRLGSEGRLAWLAAGPLGSEDGRVVLCRREQLAQRAQALAAARGEGADGSGSRSSAESAESPDPIERALAERLAVAGASFFSEIVAALPAFPPRAIEQALFALAARGEVTNDTFAPLRAPRDGWGASSGRARSRTARAGSGRPRRPGRHAPPPATAGRWSLIAAAVRGASAEAAAAPDAPTASVAAATERLHRRVLALLDRHGIVSRETLEAEREVGGFAAILPVLRALEEAGRVRRGHFVEGGTSAQFALPGAVDRLRAARATGESPQAVLLASLDPAQPYGAALPWPPAPGGRPRRAVGTSVVLVDGRATLFLERGGRQLVCFTTGLEPEAGAASGRVAAVQANAAVQAKGEVQSNGAASSADEVHAARLLAALRLLARSVARLGLRRLAVTRIDGEPALRSPLAPRMRAAGFRESERGFEVDRLAASND